LRSRNFLIRASLLRDKVQSFTEYPFSIPAIGGLHELDFEQPVTFFIGENGSGKSTLLEALPRPWGSILKEGAAISTSRRAHRIPG